MEEFDLVVIGGGSGLALSSAASELGLKVALVEEGPLGGTCLNRGCIPSKMIIHAADVVETIKRAPLFGIHPAGYRVDFKRVIERATSLVDEEARGIEEAVLEDKNITLFKARGRFVGERTLDVDGKKIKGEKIVIAAGTRPSVPSIPGLSSVPFITSDQALRLKKQPASMTIVGGGYIAAELAHFFGALGTKITIIQRDPLLVPNEDKDIATAFTRVFSSKYVVFTAHTTTEVMKKNDKIIALAQPKVEGKQQKIESEQLLIAVGRVPNSDVLDVAKAGIQVNTFGYIITNERLETTAKNVWAFGDIAGKYLFKHSANLEADYAVLNVLHQKRQSVDYTAMPHAIFTSPQIAGVGERQQDLDARKADYVVGRHNYIKTGMGAALEDTEGFVKVYADRKTRKILGCHIMGSDAASLIHEVIVAMKMGGTVNDVLNTVHIHPALPEVVQRAFGAIEW